MEKYKIVQDYGYTRLYKDGVEIKNLQSIEFSRKSADEIATLTIKVLCLEAEIEINNDTNKECNVKIDKTVSKGDNLDR